MSAPEVSVVIPAHDVAAVIGEQLAALAAQRGAPRFEIVIADNGSSDGLAGAAAGFREDLDLHIVDASAQHGASFARNRGAAVARGRILLFCDADDLVSENWVSAMAAAVQDGGRCLASSTLLHEGFNDSAVLAAYGIGSDLQRLQATDEPPTVAEEGFAGYLPSVPGCGFGILRSDYWAVNGMDAAYPGGSEETDFSWRFLEAGGTMLRVPAATMQYRLRSTPRALLRQQRIQQLARILLWIRFRDRGMNGPSAKDSLLTVAREAPRLLLARDRESRLLHARLLGGHLGALQGMLRYRILRRIPARRIGEGLEPAASASSSSPD
ncbi:MULTISPECIES: glycosyltransferase family 2 protein [Kocuria]|uniref:glycosyltransferase family 2 protein n=1 Tax=Kocuria TaxID=57493 RepID=UPI0024693918|nr:MULTISPECIES: glycosyltransferase family 2 protein [Kocuria]MDH5151468.1 glycosyltransferase [Kocuria palustris]GLU87407.1 hypothetical protein Kosp01_21530 [Kocuria sp. NBRC 114282]